MGLIDKDDVGLAVGGGLGAIVAASMGAGPVGIAVTTIIGAYGGINYQSLHITSQYTNIDKEANKCLNHS